MANVRWWWKEGNLGAISPIIDKILHAEVVPQPYVAAHARTYQYGSDTNAIVDLYI